VHPLTSYSLPFALQLAIGISALDNLSPQSLGECCHAWALQHWRQGRFYRMLTRMLFEASSPARRYTILERFYRLPEPLIERFYAGRSTRADMMRILCGKPPVPLGRAISSLLGSGSGLASLELPR
jgi:lycopene beta-cyclase